MIRLSTKAAVQNWRARHERVAFVPTMGALHQGHLALVRAAKAASVPVLVSIFVNPAQFGPHEDFAVYPRDLERDVMLLEREGVEALYAPSIEDIYGEGSLTQVRVGGSLTQGLCAPFRPGHFEGVALIVLKLFQQVRPDHALFGEKDWQQLQVIRRMVRDLDVPVAIKSVGTLREADGLALSSRNARLSPQERRIAAALPRILRETADALLNEGESVLLCQSARQALLAAGFRNVDYVECCDSESLVPVEKAQIGQSRLFAAAWLGQTRLIDNWPV
jgi:pantoate--beta-alanine ligase